MVKLVDCITKIKYDTQAQIGKLMVDLNLLNLKSKVNCCWHFLICKLLELSMLI
jgi:hypothetical protein